MAAILLHGTLHVKFYSMEGGRNGFPNQLRQNTGDGNNVRRGEGFTNLYASIDLEKKERGERRRTMRYQDHIDLRLNVPFDIYCAHKASEVVFTVKNDSSGGSTTSIGTARVHVNDLLKGEQIDRPVKKSGADHNKVQIRVKLQYSDVTKGHNWGIGIASPEFPGVPHTYFPQKKGCKVSLYQDAHVPDHFAPKILLDGGQTYRPQRCWEDMFNAIKDAKYLIYITGWSVYTEITLVRDPSRPRSVRATTLGELLKEKAEQGVTVLMLVWEDKTGRMGTHHKETTKYFSKTKVQCVSCSRQTNNHRRTNLVNNLVTPLVFTHHQKTLVVDSELPGEPEGKRRIVSFVGGIDLCDGRYDTPFHSLFRTLGTVHRDDFYQPNFPNAQVDKGGPREPWHDIHARLEGPIAWDVLTNFEQRWEMQGKKDVPLRKWEDDGIILPSPVPFDDQHDTWNVQLFRSMDVGRAAPYPDVEIIPTTDNRSIDRSIQDAYINAIRRAKNFIYIENQYFIGSSYAWGDDHGDARSLHQIPKELSLKIVSKIKARERFSVYVVVPMWPEGIPDSDPVQIILDGQRKTMEMMYKDIVEALNEERIVDDDPRNYLAFFCLGNREKKRNGEYRPPKRPKLNSHYMRAQEARRFMIYVHSKMMIVDDEYIMVGSANINQRSMDGARDSEIAMGGYQPHHINTGVAARGEIHGFRMSVWYEHLGRLEECFVQPESIECVKKVKQLGDKNWDLYSREEESLESDLAGHLLRYPVEISAIDGTVAELPGHKFFPDTQARVLGNLRSASPKRKRDDNNFNSSVSDYRRKLEKKAAPYIFYFQP